MKYYFQVLGRLYENIFKIVLWNTSNGVPNPECPYISPRAAGVSSRTRTARERGYDLSPCYLPKQGYGRGTRDEAAESSERKYSECVFLSYVSGHIVQYHVFSAYWPQRPHYRQQRIIVLPKFFNMYGGETARV